MGNKSLWISFLNIFIQLRVPPRIDGQVLDLQPTGYNNLSQMYLLFMMINIKVISFLSKYTTYCTKKAWSKYKMFHITVQLVFFLYHIKRVWQVTAYLEITFWWKVFISPLWSSPLTCRSASNSYLNVRIKLFLFCL